MDALGSSRQMEGLFTGLKGSPRRKVYGLCEPCGSKRLLDFPGIRGHKNARAVAMLTFSKQFFDEELPPRVLGFVCLSNVDAKGRKWMKGILGPLGFDAVQHLLSG